MPQGFSVSTVSPSSVHQDILVRPYFHRVRDKIMSNWVNLKAELHCYLGGITNHRQGFALLCSALLSLIRQ